MSFSAETDKLVNDLIQSEYKNACDNFGDKYHSFHEGYAILKEEIEEVEDEQDRLKSQLQLIWESIRYDYLEINVKDVIENGLENVFSQIKELAQVGAVLMKIKNTVGEVEEC